jgi:ribosomal-protein-serine acetyltransferase
MFTRVIDEGVELRILEERHAEALHAAAERNRASLREWLFWADLDQTVDDTRAFIRAGLEQYANNEGFHAGIWVDGRLAGGIGVHKIDWRNRQTSIGYWLDASCRGRGIVTRACRVLISHLFDELGLNRLEIRCAVGNTKSLAIPERLGFTREGVIRQGEWVGDRPMDLAVYGLLRSEWRAS